MTVSRATADLVRERAKGRCEYCLLPEAYSGLPHVIDHVIAQQHDGGDSEDNLALACQRCNLLKGPNIAGLDPTTGELTRLFHPRQDAWPDHLRLEGADVVGLTAVGRTVVRLLEMNESARHSVRESLLLEGVRLG